MGSLWDEANLWMHQRAVQLKEDPSKVLLKAVEEIGEVSEAYLKQHGNAKLGEELADVVICLGIFAAGAGIDLEAEISRKCWINKQRKGRVKDGIFVKEADDLSDRQPA